MPVCSRCQGEFEDYSMGVKILPVYFERSPKSGRLIDKEDYYPDGTFQKFLCSECVGIVADDIGIFEPGNDFPPPLEAQ